MLSYLVTLVAILATAYYFLYMKKEEERKKKEIVEPVKEEEGEDKKTKKQQQQNKKKKKIQPQQKKQKQPQEKPHDPSSHARYIRRFGGHQRDITAIALSPNGEWMATTCVDGQLRVARVEKDKAEMFVRANIDNHDKICSMSWEGDNRTIACVLDRTGEVAFYRVRKKKDATAASGDDDNNDKPATTTTTTSGGAFPYECIELVKRRFPTEDKLNKITGCLMDQTSTSFHLVLLSGDTLAKPNAKTILAWDGMTGQHLSTLSTGGNNGDVRLSHDGKFIAGRCGGNINEVKLFEIIKKRHKGEVDPQYDSLPAKSIMTLTVGKKVSDVDFLYHPATNVCDKAVIVTVDGTIQIWNLNVEYRQQQDPKKLIELTTPDVLQGKDIVAIASNPQNYQIAVATSGSSIHMFTYSDKGTKGSITYDFSMEECHGRKGIDDIYFDATSGKVLYSKGTLSKDVFAWNVEV